jgi:hypothetical protein
MPPGFYIWYCAYCLQTLTVESLSIDHSYPLSLGGRSTLDNLKPCCKDCNQAKGELGAEEYKALRSLSAGWHPKMRAYLFRQLQLMPQGWMAGQAMRRSADKVFRRMSR